MKQKIKIAVLTLSSIAIVIIVIFSILSFMAVFYIGQHDVVGESATIERLQEIGKAEKKYYEIYNEYATIEQLIKEGYIEEYPMPPPASRARYSLEVVPRNGNNEPAYHAYADYERHYYLGSDVKEIRVNKIHQASADDPPLENKNQ